MSFTDFFSPVYKQSEQQIQGDGIGADDIQVSLEDLASESSQDGDGLFVDSKEKVQLLSRAHVNVEEEKEKPSWIHVLKTRVTMLGESPIFLATMASLSITVNRFIVKILSHKYSVFQIISTRAIGALAIALITMLWKGISPLGPTDKIPLLLLRGILGAVVMGCTWTAISLLPLSELSFLRNSHPIVTAILASLIGVEKLNWMTWLGVGGTAIGNALLAHPPFIFGGHQDWGTKRIVGLVLSAIAVLLVGSNAIIVKKIGKSVHPFVLLTYQLCCSVLISVPFLIASYPTKPKLPEEPLDLVLLFGLILLAVLSQGMIITALQRGSPTLVTSLVMTNMIYASFLGVFVLSERFSLVSGSGALVVLISVLLVVVGRGLNKKQEHNPHSRKEEAKELELGPNPNDFNQSNEDLLKSDAPKEILRL